ncbi:MAG: YbhN family protein [Acidimicrobiales bacterium]
MRRRIGRTLRILLLVVALFYVLPPVLAGALDALPRLSEVNPLLLLAGLGLQFAALVAYTQLTAACLPRHSVHVPTLLRIQLATKAVTNTVPGGSAAGSAIGYRLLVLSGVRGADAGFALATAGLGSAVVLNLLLWIALLVSIPLSGVSPIYVTIALIGVFLLATFAAIVLGLIKGQRQAERAVRALARRVRFMNEDRMGQLVGRLADRVRELINDRELLRRVIVWAVLNWLLDAASLWVFLYAFGSTVRPDSLVVAFCVAMIAAAIPVTPGGLGVIELTLTSMLAFFAVGAAAAIAVPIYRIAAFWLPIPLGVVAYGTLRVGPWKIDRQRALARMRRETAEVVSSGESIYDWAERFGHRRPDPTVELLSSSEPPPAESP